MNRNATRARPLTLGASVPRAGRRSGPVGAYTGSPSVGASRGAWTPRPMAGEDPHTPVTNERVVRLTCGRGDRASPRHVHRAQSNARARRGCRERSWLATDSMGRLGHLGTGGEASCRFPICSRGSTRARSEVTRHRRGGPMIVRKAVLLLAILATGCHAGPTLTSGTVRRCAPSSRSRFPALPRAASSSPTSRTRIARCGST